MLLVAWAATQSSRAPSSDDSWLAGLALPPGMECLRARCPAGTSRRGRPLQQQRPAVPDYYDYIMPSTGVAAGGTAAVAVAAAAPPMAPGELWFCPFFMHCLFVDMPDDILVVCKRAYDALLEC